MKIRILKEKKLTKPEKKKKEDIVMGMKGDAAAMKKRYGKDWKNVMHATATKKAKKLAEQDDDLYMGGSGGQALTKNEKRALKLLSVF